MSKLSVFNNISLDGYFVDNKSDMSWAHNTNTDEEWESFVAGNSKLESRLLFGRITYELMEKYWPTPMALENDPIVAKQINKLEKLVISKTLKKVTWENTQIINDNIFKEVSKLKQDQGKDIVILGSGSIISQLAQEDLIDEYQFVINPIIIGNGRTMFEDVKRRINLKLKSSRSFHNGNVLLHYDALH